jgi:hypothetical protein
MLLRLGHPAVVSFGGSSLVFTMTLHPGNVARPTGRVPGGRSACRVGRRVGRAVARPAASPAMRGDTFAFVTGGGTGGHVYPALAVADALVERGHARTSIRFVGARRGLEATAVPEAGYAVELLGGRGLQRSMRPRAIVANLGAVRPPRRLRRAFRLGCHRPRVVPASGVCAVPMSPGGPAPTGPAVVHEQNAAPGLANRWAVRPVPGRRCRSRRHSWVRSPPGTRFVGRRPSRGSPTRRHHWSRWSGAARRRPVNDAAHLRPLAGTPGCLDPPRGGPRLRRHGTSTGLRSTTDTLAYELVRYRTTCSSLRPHRSARRSCRSRDLRRAAVTGTPAVLVPLQAHLTSPDPQRRGAGAAGAVLIPDADLDGSRSPPCCRRLDDPAPGRDEQAARSVGRPDAASRVADLVEATARRADAS